MSGGHNKGSVWGLGIGLGLVALLALLSFDGPRSWVQRLLRSAEASEPLIQYDVVIYGGSFSGYAAARSLHRQNPGLRLLMVVPQRKLGEIGTVAAQNFWDLRGYRKDWIAGTFDELFEFQNRGYDPDAMATFMEETLRFNPLFEVKYQTDLVSSTVQEGEVREVAIRALSRADTGEESWDPLAPTIRVQARVFIDASYNARLLRLSGFLGVTGRDDYAQSTEQQAVTLMFEVEGLDFEAATKSGDFEWAFDKDGSRLLWGGQPNTHPATWKFNATRKEEFRIKPMNIAEGSQDRWWINTILMYGVDATKELKDEGTYRYPRNELMSVDEGYAKARKMVESDEFLTALRDFPGFASARISRIADMLYIRESVHSSLYPKPGYFGFAVRADHLTRAGRDQYTGTDSENYKTRIGLAFYQMDTQGYLDKDPWEEHFEDQTRVNPKFPAYIPYEALLNPNLRNVLVCGYGLNASSIAWYALRVLPNQMVMGDAAGMAAETAISRRLDPSDFGDDEIFEVQRHLREMGAILEKKADREPRLAPTR